MSDVPLAGQGRPEVHTGKCLVYVVLIISVQVKAEPAGPIWLPAVNLDPRHSALPAWGTHGQLDPLPGFWTPTILMRDHR